MILQFLAWCGVGEQRISGVLNPTEAVPLLTPRCTNVTHGQHMGGREGMLSMHFPRGKNIFEQFSPYIIVYKT